jgi:hypothetical protein
LTGRDQTGRLVCFMAIVYKLQDEFFLFNENDVGVTKMMM